MSGWISVADRLPEEDATVLTLARDGASKWPAVGWHGPGGWQSKLTPWHHDAYPPRDVTHWMPLPADSRKANERGRRRVW